MVVYIFDSISQWKSSDCLLSWYQAIKYHPALTVTNIKNLIPIVLEMEKSQYSSWAELFKIHCRAYDVLDHLTPPTNTSSTNSSSSSTNNTTPPNDPNWSCLDAVVLQRIYCTISNDLLHTILETNSTTAKAWERLQGIFQDNKNSRALYLQRQFANLALDKFSSVSAYCQELKVLANQLAKVGDTVTNDRLVLQLIAGLTESYDGVASYLQQCDPLPKFYEARSKLILEETRKMKQNPTIVDAALLTTTPPSSST